MQIITRLNDDEKFLGAMYKAIDPMKKFIETTGYYEKLSKRRFTNPPEGEGSEELVMQEVMKNVDDALRSAFLEHPKALIELAKAFVILDKGEELHGIKLLQVILDVLGNTTVINFFRYAGILK